LQARANLFCETSQGSRVRNQLTDIVLRATRIRQNIRDHIESPQSPLVLKKEAVKEVLGYPVTLDPEWLMLWKTLQAFYPDNATFVPSIATVIINWCDAFMSWLESEENEDTVEKLLDALTHVNRLDLMIEVLSSPQLARSNINISYRSRGNRPVRSRHGMRTNPYSLSHSPREKYRRRVLSWPVSPPIF
jgi:hypothetical protein